MARLEPVVVFALALLPRLVLGLPTCCLNSTSGVAFEHDCRCLVDDTQLSGQILAAGEMRIYHWVLGMNNSGLVSGPIRGNLTFEDAGDVMYSLYWSSLAEKDDGACTAASGNATLRENPNCLFWSACGLENAAEGHTDWVTLDANIGHVFEVAVDDDSSYLFNVAMMDSRNITSVYAGTSVSFIPTDYRDCVADPDCTSQLNDDSTIIAIASVAVGLLTLLIVGMTFLHKSIAKVMRETVSSRGERFHFGRTKNLTLVGDKGKGKVHVDHFDGIGGEKTPMVSPVKRFDEGKPFEGEEEEDSFETSRGRPSKRGSVGSPRSKSPPRSTARSDKEGSDRDEDAGVMGGGRSAAASPSSRYRRGGGGSKAEEKMSGEQDRSRAAPRFDRDDAENPDSGDMRLTGSAGTRVSISSGERTHKSPPVSPSPSRQEHSRSRKPSAAAPRNGGNSGDEEIGGETHDRKNRRKGDWEQQVSRSNVMQASPRRRNRRKRSPRGDEAED